MLRAVLEAAIPFLIPFALYAIWVNVSRGKAAAAESAATDNTGLAVRGHPWAWLGVAGLVLAFTVLVVTSRRERMGVQEHYAPAQLRNGEIVPGGPR